MRVRDRVRDCVVFVGRADQGKFIPYGTGFVGLREYKNRLFQYIVTAKHVLDKIGSREIFIRLNLRTGGSEVRKVPLEEWRFHPNPGRRRTVDVAVVPVSARPDYYDISHVDLDEIAATDDVIKRNDIGVGEEVAITGLFTRHWGDVRNAPLVRCGNIARMVEEPLYTPEGYMDAYLVEARSIGGLSGSPVFVNMPPVRIIEVEKQKAAAMPFEGQVYYLLGIVQGHFVIENSEDAIVEENENAGKINTGIAVVIPVQKIIETIDHPDIIGFRDRAIADMDRQSGLVRDVAGPLEVRGAPELADRQPAPPTGNDSEWLDPAEAERRRDETLKRMLSTPPNPKARP